MRISDWSSDVCSSDLLSDFCPLFAEHDGEGHGRNPVTQFDKDDVEAVGLVKFDFLGLRTLTIIDWAVKAINGRKAGMGNEGNGESTATISHRPLHSPHSPLSLVDITHIHNGRASHKERS